MIHFTFEGRAITARPGQSVTAALIAAGQIIHNTARDGSPRGPLCGIGACHDCLLHIDGRTAQRGCMTAATEGMAISRQPLLANPQACSPLATPPDTIEEIRCAVLIVGAGPAGLVAARDLALAGASVIVTDERHLPGGQFFKQPATSGVTADQQARRGARAIAAAREAGARLLHDTLVWGAFRESENSLVVGLVHNGTALYVRPRVLLVATGAQESPLPVPGWNLPGVMTTGACQTLLRAYGSMPGKRVVVTGNGPLNLQVARELLRGGSPPAALVEGAAPPWRSLAASGRLGMAEPGLALSGLRQIATLRRHRVPMLWNSRLVRVEGDQRVKAAVVADSSGRERRIEADTICIGDGFVPANELARLLGCAHRYVATPVPHLEVERDDVGRTSLADVFVVGEAGGFGGAMVAQAQGALAAQAILGLLGYPTRPARAARRQLQDARAFQSALWTLYALHADRLPDASVSDETIICRCEALSLGMLRKRAREDGITDIPTLKRVTRAGMGRCQGRFCGAAVGHLLGHLASEADFPAPQMPLRPIPLAALAREKHEWHGHKRSVLPPAAPPARQCGNTRSADVVVIGGGVVGAATALFLARAGRKVTVLERGQPGAGASGGNAGSLHAQLLSFDYRSNEQGLSPAARTLPLQRASIDLWGRLQEELDRDIEMKVTGGIMLAETEHELERLRGKVAIERAQGITCEILDEAAIRAHEPAIAPGFLGGAWCPQEGKINPLAATQALLVAARRAGAQIVPHAAVSAITRQAGGGFTLSSQAGTWSAPVVVNAAGAFATRVAAMVGLDLPVHGAPLQMIVTEPVAPLVRCLVAHAGRHLTLKQAANGSVLIGGGWSAGLDPVHHRPRPLRESLEGNTWIAQHVIPALRGVHIVRSWAAMNIDIDGAPILGADAACPGFFNAVTSNGFTLGPIMGQITADLILGAPVHHEIDTFSVARFRKSPP
ncbi:ferredoxin [Komagataeibacter xylinus]|uniref:Ferredoxin n=1 Tax=Komagataeibacter xylinus TaxID=28448 RepID=A0A318PNU4_KOMXY|nr:FAD-dependent oxidoreductase [Komagataeibacter xylinus]PYD56734.1 ferredoxin [Komagataeibacter xylinus]GBQ74070.1 putative NAD/FAD-dependent oxidoreductase [Komagataeibacter xylinus NBRC 15237]